MAVERREKERHKRVVVRVTDPYEIVAQMRSERGRFVPTDVNVGVNEVLQCAVWLGGDSRPVELSVRVIGRRPRGRDASGKVVAAGLMVRLEDAEDAGALQLLSMGATRVAHVDKTDGEAEELVEARFENFPALESALAELLEGEAGTFPILGDVRVRRGDRVLVEVSLPDQPRVLTLQLLVRGLVGYAEERALRGVLYEDGDTREIIRFLNRQVSLPAQPA